MNVMKIRFIRLWPELEESEKVWIRNQKQGVLLKAIEHNCMKERNREDQQPDAADSRDGSEETADQSRLSSWWTGQGEGLKNKTRQF